MKINKTVAKLSAYAVLFLCIFCTAALAVPVIPNKAVAKGTVVEYYVTSSGPSNARGRALCEIVLSVESVEDVADNPNFLKEKKSGYYDGQGRNSRPNFSERKLRQQGNTVVTNTGAASGSMR